MSAGRNGNATQEREEIEALLPWYVSGKLEPQLAARVRQYLDAHPEIERQITIAREESEAVIGANKAIGRLGPAALDRLRASVAAHPRKLPLAMRMESWRDAVTAVIATLAPSQIALAGTAAAFLILLQAGVIGTLMVERGRAPVYETASGPQDAQPGIELLVAFRDTATAAEINALLDELNARIIDGPRSGLYRLRVPATDGEDGGRPGALRTLQQSEIVGVVLPGK